MFTGTVLSGIRHDCSTTTVRPRLFDHDCSTIVLILRGFAQGVPTQHLADELDLDYSMLLTWRHRLQASALEGRAGEKLSDAEAEADAKAEADEMVQNAGEKGQTRPGREGSPRRRANLRRNFCERGPVRLRTTASPSTAS